MGSDGGAGANAASWKNEAHASSVVMSSCMVSEGWRLPEDDVWGDSILVGRARSVFGWSRIDVKVAMELQAGYLYLRLLCYPHRTRE